MEEDIKALAEKIQDLTEESVSKPTLVYFDVVGIAWPIRCLLHLKDVDYDLIQVTAFQWGQLKQVFINGHVPLYVDKDIRLTQSIPMMSYLSEKYDMAGKDQKERMAVMEIMCHAYDALFHWNGLLQVIIKMGIPDDVVEARRQAFMGEGGTWGVATNGYKNHLDGFQRYLDANPSGSGFFIGDELTIADLHAFNLLCNWYKAFARERFTEEYPALEAYIQRIAAIPKINDYIRNLQEPTSWLPLPMAAIALTTPPELEGLVG